MNFYCYIMSNRSKTLYTGVTNELRRRVAEHRAGIGCEITRKYYCHMLAWYERFGQIDDAIAAEKRIKGWTRAKKVALIEASNPDWRDLSDLSS